MKEFIDKVILKRSPSYRRYFSPKLTYSMIGLFVLSLIAINQGASSILNYNINSLFPTKEVPTSTTIQYPQSIPEQTQTVSVILPEPPKYTSIDESMKDIDYVNNIRASYGINSLKFDSRVYNLALARVNDMDKYGYLDHTNPYTGTCAFSIKSEFGLTSDEFVAENAFGYSSSSGMEYYSGIEKDAINSWMSDRGHKYNMLYPHFAAAVVCSSGGHCVFEGLNHDSFTNACYTAAQGEAFWASAGTQPYEHT